jgi:hypothetical protein
MKVALAFSGRRDVVLSVPRSERRRIALHYGDTDGRFATIRFEACTNMRHTIAPGALIYGGRWRRCVPLRLNGRRVLMPLGRRCP